MAKHILRKIKLQFLKVQKKGENKGAVQPLFADFLIIASFEIWVCPHVVNIHCFGFKKLCVTKLWFFNGLS